MKKIIILLLLTTLALPVHSKESYEKKSTLDFIFEKPKPTEKYTEEGAVDDSEAQAYGRELRKAYMERIRRGEFSPGKSYHAYYITYPLLKFYYEGVKTDPNSL